MTIEEVKNFLSEDEKGIELLNSLTDQRVSKSIETYKKNHEMGEIKRLQEEISILHAEKQRKGFEDIAKDAGVPDDLLQYVQGNTEEEILKSSEGLVSALTTRVEKERTVFINQALGGAPPVGGETLSPVNMSNMTSDEILSNLNNFRNTRK